MDAADPRRSPPDRGGGSSSTPLRQTGGGSSSTPPAAGNQPEVIDVDDDVSVLGITPALVYDMEGEVYVLPADTGQAGNDFKVPDAYRREGSGERSFMYSLGVYIVPLAEEDHMADPAYRKNKTTVP